MLLPFQLIHVEAQEFIHVVLLISDLAGRVLSKKTKLLLTLSLLAVSLFYFLPAHLTHLLIELGLVSVADGFAFCLVLLFNYVVLVGAPLSVATT